MKTSFHIALFLAGFLSCTAIHAQTQDKPAPKPVHPIVQTSPDGARFELVLTDTESSPTLFRFDKFTGDLWQLSSGFRPLKLIPFTREADEADLAEEGRINYQLVARSSSTFYLINLNTGVMWEKAPDDLFRRTTYLQVVREQ